MEILLIEDNADHAFLSQEAIRKAWPEATLHTVSDASEAHALITNSEQNKPQRFDLILATLDQHSPEAFTRLSDLQDLHPCSSMRIPLILLVNSTREQQLAQVANHPREWILLKPLQASALHATLEPKKGE